MLGGKLGLLSRINMLKGWWMIVGWSTCCVATSLTLVLCRVIFVEWGGGGGGDCSVEKGNVSKKKRRETSSHVHEAPHT